ncbi:MAG: PqqD family protein [Candidatus Omnitrophica bacterium]|nr:PqqD family protein [Candidatus Omnitrophota bacterium]
MEDQGKVFNRKKNIVCTELPDGEAVLLNLESNYFYTLNQEAFVIWKSLNGRDRLIDVIDKIIKHYEADRQEIKEAVLNQIEEFLSERLIEIIP